MAPIVFYLCQNLIKPAEIHHSFKDEIRVEIKWKPPISSPKVNFSAKVKLL